MPVEEDGSAFFRAPSGVPFFLKQLGGYPDKRGGEKAVLDGRRWIQMPSTSVARQGVLAGTE